MAKKKASSSVSRKRKPSPPPKTLSDNEEELCSENGLGIEPGVIIEYCNSILTDWSSKEADADQIDIKIAGYINGAVDCQELSQVLFDVSLLPRLEKSRQAMRKRLGEEETKMKAVIETLCLLDAARSKTCKTSQIKELLTKKEVIKKTLTEDLTTPLIQSLWNIRIGRLIAFPAPHSEEGIKLLSFLMSYVSRDVTDVMLNQVIVTDFVMTPDAKVTVLLASFARVVHNAWLQCVDPSIKMTLEQFVENMVLQGVTYDKPVSVKVLQVIKSFYAKKDNATREFVCRVIPGVLYEFLHSANWKVRRNSFVMYCHFFPLVDHNLPAREYELEMERSFELLKSFPIDPHPSVRVAAIKSLCELMDECWGLFPSDIVVELLSTIFESCGRDAKSPAVREAAIVGITHLLKHPIAQELLKEALPTWSNSIHDTSIAVRQAMAQLLVVTARVPEYHYCSVVPLEQITSQFLIDGLKYQLENKEALKPVCQTLTNLLFESIKQESRDPSAQLQVVQAFVKDMPFALLLLFKLSQEALSPLESLRLSAGLFQLSMRHILRAAECSEEEGLKTGSILLSLSADLLTLVPFSESTKKKNAIHVPTVKNFLEENFKSEFLMTFLSHNQLKELPFGNIIQATGKRIIAALLRLPYKKGEQLNSLKVVVVQVGKSLQECQAIGSQEWLELVRLASLASHKAQLKSYLAEWLKLLSQLNLALESQIKSQQTFPFNDEDILLSLRFVQALPQIIKLLGIEDPFRQTALQTLKQSYQLSLTASILKREVAFSSTHMMAYVTLVALDPEDTDQIKATINEILEALSSFDISNSCNVETLVSLMSMGRSVLADNTVSRDDSVLEWLYKVIPCLLVLLVLTFPMAGKGEEGDENDPFSFVSLYGIRNACVQCMLMLTQTSDQVFWFQYKRVFKLFYSLFECLHRSPLITKAELVSSLKLFSTFALLDMVYDESLTVTQDGYLKKTDEEEASETLGSDDDAPKSKKVKLADSSYKVTELSRPIARMIHPHLYELTELLNKVKSNQASYDTLMSEQDDPNTNTLLTSHTMWTNKLPTFTRDLLLELWRSGGSAVHTGPLEPDSANARSVDVFTSIQAIESLRNVTGKTPIKARDKDDMSDTRV